MLLAISSVATLHVVATESHRAEHEQPATGSEVPGLHGHIMQKATMLAVTHHVVTENSAQ
jgi:hypothetical protein